MSDKRVYSLLRLWASSVSAFVCGNQINNLPLCGIGLVCGIGAIVLTIKTIVEKRRGGRRKDDRY